MVVSNIGGTARSPELENCRVSAAVSPRRRSFATITATTSPAGSHSASTVVTAEWPQHYRVTSYGIATRYSRARSTDQSWCTIRARLSWISRR
jgi:hypothetical protein